MDKLDKHERDIDLVSRVAAGDEDAIARLTRIHADHVHALAARFTGNPADAEEIAQEVFLTLWQSAGKWQSDRARFTTWLYRVTVNKCVDWDRRRRVRNFFSLAVPEDVMDEKPLADQRVEDRENLDLIRRHILKLPAKQRAALLLSIQMDKSNKEIAEVLGVTTGAVEQLLVRARRKLRDILGHPGARMEPLS